jgi:hypothetical protein
MAEARKSNVRRSICGDRIAILSTGGWPVRVYFVGYRMPSLMKANLEIARSLLQEAKALARSEGTTVRALIERGLRLALDERRASRRFKLRDASVAGKGMHPDAAGLSWNERRALSYGITAR